MRGEEVVQADLTWIDSRFEPDCQIVITGDGRIASVGKAERAITHRLRGCALLPGFVNAHSHAFQRGLRGVADRFTETAGSFWTWRQAMYEFVDRLDAVTFSRICLQAFEEMRDVGITTVGEFHYLHHSAAQADYAFDELVLAAAARAGIRIVLLNAYYAAGGVDKPLSGAQCRFASSSPDTYWRQMDHLASILDPNRQSLGAVVHSVRAAHLNHIVAVHREAVHRGLVLHMHVEEQRGEIEECVGSYGKPPMAVLNDALDIGAEFTAVHCTHTRADDMTRFLSAGGRVCVCPLTEANLGDGIPDLPAVHRAGGRLSLGSDSNAQIDMIEEMRWLEYGQRLRSETRGVLTENGRVAQVLMAAATSGGADALGLDVGALAPGRWADLVAIDLTQPALVGVDADVLLEALVFGAGTRVVSGTCVGGRWRRSTGARQLPEIRDSAAT